jgi:hypothetical protein
MRVEKLKHNVIRVRQMCDQGHNLTFDSQECEIRKENSGNLVAKAIETPNNIYILDENNGEK